MATATAPVPAPAKQAPTVAPSRSTHPFELMRHFAQEMDRVFGDFGLRTRWPFTSVAETETALWAPDLEVTQDQGKLQVRLDLPGLKKEDVKVEVTDESLVVQGERRQEEEKTEKGYYRSERSYGRFYRSVALPETARAHPENFVVVTLRNDHAPPNPYAGSTARGYRAPGTYRASAAALGAVRSIAAEHQLRAIAAWPIELLGVHCVVFELPTTGDRARVLDGTITTCEENDCVEWRAPSEIPWDELAFPSTREALREWVAARGLMPGG